MLIEEQTEPSVDSMAANLIFGEFSAWAHNIAARNGDCHAGFARLDKCDAIVPDQELASRDSSIGGTVQVFEQRSLTQIFKQSFGRLITPFKDRPYK